MRPATSFTNRPTPMRSRATAGAERRKKLESSAAGRPCERSAIGGDRDAEMPWPVRRQRNVGEDRGSLFGIVLIRGGRGCHELVCRHGRLRAENHCKEAG